MENKFNSDIKNEDVLSLCNKIYFYDKPENSNANEYIRWFILDEEEKCFAGEKALYTSYDIQVDIFTNKSYREIGDTIIKTLRDKKYNLISNKNSVVKVGDSKLFNKTLRFRFNKYN